MSKDDLAETELTHWLNSFCCNNCVYFIEKKCTHENSEENEKDKPFLIEHHNKIGKPFNLEWARNINSYFLCENFKTKTQ